MKIKKEPDIPSHLVFTHGIEIEDILRRAGMQALRRHKLLGNPVAVWRDGRVVILSPEEITIKADTDGEDEERGEGSLNA
jgi:hypothetical protein